MGLFEYLRAEWDVISRAPVTFIVGAIVIVGATWAGATVFYQEELAKSRQTAASAIQDRDLYKDRLAQASAVPPPAPMLARQPPPRADSSDPLGEKVPMAKITGIPMDFVLGAFKGRTEVEAQRLIQPYINSHVDMSGVVEDVMTTSDGEIMLIPRGPFGKPLVRLYFDKQKSDQVLKLRADDPFSAHCRFYSSDDLHTDFDKCTVALTP